MIVSSTPTPTLTVAFEPLWKQPEYANPILNGDPEKYLKAVTEYKPLDF